MLEFHSVSENKINSYSPYIIESMIRGFNIKDHFCDFFRIHCPKFSQFRSMRELISSEGTCSGKGFDIVLESVHSLVLCMLLSVIYVIDARLKILYREFLEKLENLINEKLEFIGVSPEQWETAIFRIISESSNLLSAYKNNSLFTDTNNNMSIIKFVVQLQRYEDFIYFGEMMEDFCDDFYPKKYTSCIGEIGRQRTEEEKGERNVASTSATSSYLAVRVLWDIENIPPLPSTRHCPNGTLLTVQLLTDFLHTHGFAGKGVDCRITTFADFLECKSRPTGASKQNKHSNVQSDSGQVQQQSHYHIISRSIINELDKANVEIIYTNSHVKEDADRKLSHRMLQEMLVLKPLLNSNHSSLPSKPSIPQGDTPSNGNHEITTNITGDLANKTINSTVCFILISSDQDFRQTIQLATNQGFDVVIIHQANSGNVGSSRRWEQTLQLCATQCFRWDEDVLCGGSQDGAEEEIKDTTNTGKEISRRGQQVSNTSNNSRHGGNKQPYKHVFVDGFAYDAILTIKKALTDFAFGEVERILTSSTILEGNTVQSTVPMLSLKVTDTVFIHCSTLSQHIKLPVISTTGNDIGNSNVKQIYSRYLHMPMHEKNPHVVKVLATIRRTDKGWACVDTQEIRYI